MDLWVTIAAFLFRAHIRVEYACAQRVQRCGTKSVEMEGRQVV